LRRIELERFSQLLHPLVDQLARIHSLAGRRTLWLILCLCLGAGCECDSPGNGRGDE
jgi:hypothetical protein